MNNYFKLTIYLTILSPDGNDVCVTTSRVLPFQPIEGLTLKLPLYDDTLEGYDDEWDITLGTPTYSYLESSFVEYQEDDDVLSLIRSGETPKQAMNDVITFYEAYGFKVAK